MRSATIEDVYELSPLQRGILLHSTHDGSADMYLSQHTYAVDGPLDTAVLVRSWEAAVAAHPVLRTSFHWRELDKPLQVVHREVPLPVRHHDWSGDDEHVQAERLETLQTQDRAAGIDPETAPLQRLAVIRLGENRHRILWTYHHVLLDGWSIPLVLDEVMAWYRSLAGGAPEPRPVPAYRDYIGWLQRQDDREARAFWTETLAGVSPTRVAPHDASDDASGTGAVLRRIVPIPAATSERLRDAAAGHRVTPSTIVQAVWATVLQRLTGRSEITFGSATSGRPADLPEVDRMVGLLANTLPLRVTVPDGGDLGTWLRSIQDRYAAMRRYEFTPLAEIKKCAGMPGRQLFDSLLVMENYSLAVDTDSAGEEALSFRVETLYDKIDLPLTLTVAPHPVSEMQLLIHEARFAPGFADDLLERLYRTLDAAVTSDDVATVIAAAGPPVIRPAAAEPAGPARPAGPAEPSTPREIAVAAAFEEILGVPVDAVTGFFELGGDSFDAVRAVGRLDGAGVALLAANPTVRELAAALDAAEPADELDDEIAALERALESKRAAKKQRAAPAPVSRDGLLPCSRQQEGLWFMHRLDPLSPVYNIPFGLRLHGALDVAALRRALHALVVRHEPLRTRFTESDGVAHQVIDPPPEELALPVTELTDADAWATEQARLPFDLEHGSAFRAALARVGPDEHVLVVVVHHIVADGWSALIMARELSLLYDGAALPPLTVQAADLAVEQRASLDGAELERQLGYWREHLAGLSTVDMPADRPRPARPTGAGGATRRTLPDATAAAANAYSRTHGVSFLAVLQAGLLTVLHHYTGQTDLTIGSIFSGRTRPETEQLVGYFANTLVLRTHLSPDSPFTELIQRCQRTVLDATERQDLPFTLLVEDLAPERVPGRNPLFQISLTLQPGGAGADMLLGDVRAEPLELTDGRARFDILINASNDGGRLDLMVEYSAELFDADRIERLLDHVTAALTNGLADPGVAVADVAILGPAERSLVTGPWTGSPDDVPVEPVHRMIEDAVARTPDATALIDHDGTVWTFRELDRASNRLAHVLRRHGVGPDVPVGVRLERGADMVLALLASLKAGGGYLPLDPELPPDRLAFMLADAAPPVVLTHERFGPVPGPAAVLALDTGDVAAGEPDTPPAVEPGVDNLAVVLFTSGSTGTPKGVLISHRGVHKQVAWMQAAYRLDASDRVLQKTSFGFDVSSWEFFWPLATGAVLVMAAPGGHRDPAYLHGILAHREITTVHFVPSMLETFLDAVDDGLDPAAVAHLRRVYASGEALGPGLVDRFLRVWPDVELHNLYGPTEAPIDVTSWRCEPGVPVVPIGRPLWNMRTYVLDGRLRPAPIGVPGRLFAGGPVSAGYLGRPGLTAERFLPDPFAGRPGARMYDTGDLCRWRADGELEYLGRTDRQVKVHGQRIELGEIEHALTGHPSVRRAAVVLDGTRLVAYLVPSGEPDPDGLADHLVRRLPPYMIPTAFVPLDELPVTRNGKLDVAALPSPAAATTEYVAPRTPTEVWLAATCEALLGVPRAGLHDGFFDLGGNSLRGIALIARVRAELGRELEPRYLFTDRTIEQLAARIDAAAGTGAADVITPAERDGLPLPCTHQQESLWLLHRLDPASATYHIPFALRLRGELDRAALERALAALVGRHEALRTRFVEHDGLPHQVVEPAPAAVALPLTELTDDDDSAAWATAEIDRPFDLAAGPPFRAALARLAADHHIIVFVVHHIVADGWSATILAAELSRLYAAESTGEPAGLDAPALQPGDHAVHQRRDPQALDAGLAHWTSVLADLPTLDLPADRPRRAHPTGAGDVLTRRLDAATGTAVHRYAREHDVSLLAVLHAGLLVVLHRYTGQTDLVVGSIFSGRTRPELEPVVGYFANPLVLRTDAGGDPAFDELVRRCHDVVVDAAEHQDVPFATIVDALAPERVPGRNPLFQVSLTLQPAALRTDLVLGATTAGQVDLTGGHARFDLALDVTEDDDGITVGAEFSTELFDGDRIDRLLGHLGTALGNAMTGPDTPIDDIEIMSADERRLVTGGWDTAAAPAGPSAGGR